MASIRTLPADLQEIATRELFEVPERIPEDLKALKEWIKKQSHLTSRTDDQFLLAFLRGSKFSLQKTKERLQKYYVLKTSTKEFFHSRDPEDAKLQAIMDLGISLIMPLPSDGKAAPRLTLCRYGAFDLTKIEFIDVMKVAIMLSDLNINDCDISVIVGHIVVLDLQGSGVSLGVHATPWIRKLVMLMETFPIRVKALHFINPPLGFETAFKIVRTVVSEKIGKRIYVHPSFEDLHKVVSKSLLPAEYGGDNSTITEIAAHWKSKLLAYRNWFLEDVNYGVKENYISSVESPSSSFDGVQGSFRKLEID